MFTLPGQVAVKAQAEVAKSGNQREGNLRKKQGCVSTSSNLVVLLRISVMPHAGLSAVPSYQTERDPNHQLQLGQGGRGRLAHPPDPPPGSQETCRP